MMNDTTEATYGSRICWATDSDQSLSWKHEVEMGVEVNNKA